MNWTLEKAMLNINEALLNLKDDYPNKDQANRAYGALTSLIDYPIAKVIMIFHGHEEPGPHWVEVKEYPKK